MNKHSLQTQETNEVHKQTACKTTGWTNINIHTKSEETERGFIKKLEAHWWRHSGINLASAIWCWRKRSRELKEKHFREEHNMTLIKVNNGGGKAPNREREHDYPRIYIFKEVTQKERDSILGWNRKHVHVVKKKLTQNCFEF